MRARQAWLTLQRRIAGSLGREVARIAPAPHRGFARYRREYERDLDRSFFPSSVTEVVRDAERSHVVHVGDFHALGESQRTALRLLEELRTRPRPVILGLEMAERRRQADLDAFFAGRLSEAGLRRKLRWEESWGFDWEGYRDVLRFARAHGVRLLALNEADARATLADRDRAAAETVAAATLREPRAIVITLMGELHVSRSHLPAAVARALAARGARRRQLVIHQSPERLYWALAARGLEDRVGVVRLQGGDAYAVFTATPAAQHFAFLDWLDRSERVTISTDDAALEADWSLVDLTDSLKLVVEAIARYFEVPTRGLLDFTLSTGDPEEFLHLLRVRRRATAAEIRRLKRLVSLGPGTFLPQGNHVFLPRFTLGEAGALAAQLIHRVRAGSPREPMAPRQYFYFRVWREALGILGRKLLDPKTDLCRPRAKRRDERSRLVDSLLARHDTLARRDDASNASARWKFPFRQPLEIHVPLTRAIGAEIGEAMFRAILDESLSRAEARAIFLRPLHPGDAAAELYFALRRRLLEAPRAAAT